MKFRPIALAAMLTLGSASSAFASPTGVWRGPNEAWEKVCSRCHLSGVGPELRGRQLPPEYIKQVVRHGFLAMPAFPHGAIDDATLDGVALYVSKSRLNAPVKTAAPAKKS
ncbi:hypothetical protein FHW96_002024 [Novosphingobium sp. SG751A]|uniref:c-type cytochrome n=1 Tax=Novosphingobium sp. SG751A TaxID=2587000 RepID=UPI001554DE9E|nr:cytochrome c [Novosphingobium sp. SG751A]NOW45866.1 hypothetical protein [Novosphingobium sp. SG751A]